MSRKWRTSDNSERLPFFGSQHGRVRARFEQNVGNKTIKSYSVTIIYRFAILLLPTHSIYTVIYALAKLFVWIYKTCSREWGGFLHRWRRSWPPFAYLCRLLALLSPSHSSTFCGSTGDDDDDLDSSSFAKCAHLLTERSGVFQHSEMRRGQLQCGEACWTGRRESEECQERQRESKSGTKRH